MLPPSRPPDQQIVDEARAGVEAFEAVAAELTQLAGSGDDVEGDALEALIHPDDD